MTEIDFEDALPAIGIGFAALVVYVLASFVLPLFLPLSVAIFSLGIPYSVSQGVIFNFLTVGIFFPIIEELFFGWFLREMIEEYFDSPIAVSFIVRALLFSSYHWFVYTQGGFISAVNPFIGAFVFRITADLLITATDNLLSGIAFHMGVNISLVLKSILRSSGVI